MKTMKRTFLLTNILLLIVGIAFANTVTSASNIPSYYSSVDGLSGKTLYDAVSTVTKTGYSSLGYDGLYTAYKTTDSKSDGTIWDMYSDCSFSNPGDKCGSYSAECDCFNREHSIPQSWWGGGTTGIGCDIFHVLPTDGKVNGMRSNYVYGEVSSASYTSKNGTKLGSAKSLSVLGKTIVGNSGITASLSDKVFEPIDEYKGDIARGYLGALVKWGAGLSKFPQGNGTKVFSGTYTAAGYFGLTEYGVALLLKWHRQDPVSQKEIDRNNGIQKTQGNRNPFIDYPYLVEYIWGSHAGETVNLDELINSSDSRFTPGVSDGSSATSTTPTIIVNTTALTFANAEVGTASTMTFTVKGSNITSDISLSLSGTNASLFSVSPNTISASAASNTSTITVTYTPTQIGTSSATLTISSNGADDKTVTLTGTSSQTVTVTWLVNGEEYTEGKPTTSVVTGNKVSVLPTAPTSCSTESEQFVGWSASQIAGTTDQVPDDLFSDAQDALVVEGDVTYYAVFAHVEETASTSGATKVQLTTSSTSGWTISGTSITSKYWKLTTGATITSPEIDLSLLESVVINARTYGGDTYKTVTISNGSEVLGAIDATSSGLANYTWTPSSTLTGTGTLTFSSTTCTTANAPGVGSITINLAGTSYTYSRFTTGCESEDTPTLVVSANSIAFGDVSKGEMSTQTLTVKGTSLTSDITLSITGTDASLFSVSPATITSAEANTTNTVTVNYQPTTSGDFSATLQITSGTLSKDITLNGTCAEVCTVTWLVDGQEYTTGDPTTSIAINNQVTTLPTAPASCNNKSEQFVGWSESAISTSQDNAPEDLFSAAADAPKVTKNTTYHAVFAHVEETASASGATTVELTTSSTSGWTISETSISTAPKGSYWKLTTGATIISPEIDLSLLESIVINARTYGGKTYKTVTISNGSEVLGSIDATSSNLANFTWTPSSTLTGIGTLTFSSTTCTTANGPGVGSITINLAGTSYTYSLYTTSCASEEPQALNVSTSAIAFGTIYEGETSTQTMTVTGTSLTSDITLSITGTDASLFSVSPATILAAEANTTNTITITYNPTTTGDFSATLHVVSGTLSQDITLSGSCIAQPALNVSTSAIAFGTIYEGETSTQTMTVTGTSLTSDITLSITGTDASLFSVSPATILAAEANTTNTITITYIPTTIGDFSATLHIVSGTLSQDITLSGSCIAQPALNVSTSAIAFGTIYEGETSTQTMTVTGTSLTSDITLSITSTDASLFSVSPTTILAADANTTNTISVTYTPATTGDFSATLHIVSGTLSQDIALSGSCPEVCTITWLVDDQEYTTGNPTTSIVINNQVTTLPTAPTSCNNKSEQFVGWSETAISTAQDDAPDDLFSTAADAPIVLQSTIYRAVFAHFEETSASYSRYTTICESTTTEVEETSTTPAAAEKIFLNGQLFIRYNGVVYDIFGQILYE